MARRRKTSTAAGRNGRRQDGRADLLKMLTHPTRLLILDYMTADDAVVLSPKELAELTGEPLGNVSYHVRQLLSARALRLVKTIPRRGAIEHHYGGTPAAQKILAAAAAMEIER